MFELSLDKTIEFSYSNTSFNETFTRRNDIALYKNWPEICRIGYKHKLLMLVLASIEADENDPDFLGLYVGFPQCFSTTKVDGPFPLSIIRELAQERGQENGSSDGAEYPDSWEVLDELNVPSIIFEVCEPGGQQTSWQVFSPTEVEKTAKQGEILLWKGQRMVLLENNYNERHGDWRIVLAPIECIALNL